MKLTQKQLRKIIQETINEAPLIGGDAPQRAVPWRQAEAAARAAVSDLIDCEAVLNDIIGTHPNVKSLLADVNRAMSIMDKVHRSLGATGR